MIEESNESETIYEDPLDTENAIAGISSTIEYYFLKFSSSSLHFRRFSRLYVYENPLFDRFLIIFCFVFVFYFIFVIFYIFFSHFLLFLYQFFQFV